MPVFACLFHIKELLSHSVSYTSKGKHSLYCADFSLSPHFIFPLPLWAQEGRTHTLTPEQAWRSIDHTQSSTRISPWHFFYCLSSLIFIFTFFLFFIFKYGSLSFPFLHSFLFFHILPPLSLTVADQTGCVPTVACLYLDSSVVSRLSVCLNVLMWTKERTVT